MGGYKRSFRGWAGSVTEVNPRTSSSGTLFLNSRLQINPPLGSYVHILSPLYSRLSFSLLLSHTITRHRRHPEMVPGVPSRILCRDSIGCAFRTLRPQKYVVEQHIVTSCRPYETRETGKTEYGRPTRPKASVFVGDRLHVHHSLLTVHPPPQSLHTSPLLLYVRPTRLRGFETTGCLALRSLLYATKGTVRRPGGRVPLTTSSGRVPSAP